MKIAQISDLHISAAGKTLGVAPMAENLGRVVDHVNQLQPDLVLISGDIANTARPDETRRAAQQLAKLDAPFYLTPGNHDAREVLWGVFGGGAIPAREASHLSYVVDTAALRIIALDSTDPDLHNGLICPARAAWLEEKLAEALKPTLLFMHHPPTKCGVAETDDPPLQGADELAAVVARHSHIERILCGHIHLSVQALWQGRLVCTAPSIGMRLRLRRKPQEESQFFASPPAFLWHARNADGTLITQEIMLDEPEGPFAFS